MAAHAHNLRMRFAVGELGRSIGVVTAAPPTTTGCGAATGGSPTVRNSAGCLPTPPSPHAVGSGYGASFTTTVEWVRRRQAREFLRADGPPLMPNRRRIRDSGITIRWELVRPWCPAGLPVR